MCESCGRMFGNHFHGCPEEPDIDPEAEQEFLDEMADLEFDTARDDALEAKYGG